MRTNVLQYKIILTSKINKLAQFSDILLKWSLLSLILHVVSVFNSENPKGVCVNLTLNDPLINKSLTEMQDELQIGLQVFTGSEDEINSRPTIYDLHKEVKFLTLAPLST